ncbi:hypothetical protein FRB94_004159 [Tulasnella sp. JGI-2019a]|nr:hypothetical protein FRB93_003544 [Tulasnella sp. JGI-2019a]KAG9002009.1 hypothetical protein FRB94_004159 [Tulasnella sp. JGI-2019a]
MIFAFGPNQSYYFNNGDGKAHWQNLPASLEKLIKENKHYKAKYVTCLALFPNGGWYILGEKSYHDENVPANIKADIVANGSQARVTNIEFDATNPDRFFIGTTRLGLMYLDGMPQDCLMKGFSMGPIGGFTKVSLGYNGTWVLQGPTLNSYNINNEEMVKHMRKDPNHIVNVVLSPYDDQHGFIEYHNGNFVYFIPKGWHVHVDKLKHSKVSIFFNTVVQSEVFKEVVGELEDKGKDKIKDDIKSALAN